MVYSSHRDSVNNWLADVCDEGELPVLDTSGRCFVRVGEHVGKMAQMMNG